MSDAKLKEFEIKLQRIHALMEEKNYDALVIGTQTNFSWISCGGESKVLLTSDVAVAYLVFTKDERFVVAYTMDGPRNLDEELAGMGFQPVFIQWIDGSLEETALDLIKGKRILSDIPLPGAEGSMTDFYALHYPLTEWEIERYRAIDHEAEKILRGVVDRVKPGMLETEVEAMLTCEYSRAGYFPVVMLIGSDERIFKYRHLLPKPKPIDKYLMIILALKKYGLNSVLTRSVYFGS
jgi:Xaa-Pro dipeptidase